MGDDRFETVVAAGGAFFAFAGGAEREIEVVADAEDVCGWDFVKVGESADGGADVVVKSLGLDEDGVALFAPDGVEFFVRLPFEVVDFEVKIEGEETEVVAGEVILATGVAKGDDEIHVYIITGFAPLVVSRGRRGRGCRLSF